MSLRMVKTLLLGLARSSFGQFAISFLFAHMSFAIPVQRLRETASLVAFPHPAPSYPLHILIVPKRAIASLSQLTASDADFINDLFPTVQSLVTEFGLEAAGYRLIVNGGVYQDVAQLHFHLISETSRVG